MRVHQQSAYILLNRPYSETSWIVEAFSRDYGRLTLMAKGARRIKSKLKGSLLPFQPVLLSWVGKGEMPTLTSAEINQSRYQLSDHELTGDALVCGFYCNELIVNLLHRHDPHTKLFDEYHSVIMTLSQSAAALDSAAALNSAAALGGASEEGHIEKSAAVVEESAISAAHNTKLAGVLRAFEQVVMRETGYEVDFKCEADGKTLIDSAGFYRFIANQGFVRVDDVSSMQHGVVSGRVVLSMGESDPDQSQGGDELSSVEISRGKHLMRDILRQTLGQKKIVSRELFFPRSRPE